MKSTVNICAHIFLLCSIDFYIENEKNGGRGVGASDVSSVTASIGSRMELSCTTKTSILPKQVSWYRATNEDVRRCPNQTFFLDSSSVFCDRLTNNRIVQPGFVNTFSVPALGSDNVNGLIINRVELSDSGVYACVGNDNKILSRINFTTREDSTQTAISSNVVSLPTTSNAEQSSVDDLSMTTVAPSQIISLVQNSSTTTISLCGAAIVCVILAIVIVVVFLKNRKLKEDRIEMGSFKNIASDGGQLAFDQKTSNETGTNESLPRLTDNDRMLSSVTFSPVYDLLKASDGDEPILQVHVAAAEAGEMKCGLRVNSNGAVVDETFPNVQIYPIYAVVKSEINENKTSEAETTFNPATMTAFNPTYGEISDRNNVITNETGKEDATFSSRSLVAFNPIYGEITASDNIAGTNSTLDEIEKTAADEVPCSKSKTVQPSSPNVGLDGTVYLELSRRDENGVVHSVQQRPKQHFEKSIYAMIDHNDKPPSPPPPALPRRSQLYPH